MNIMCLLNVWQTPLKHYGWAAYQSRVGLRFFNIVLSDYIDYINCHEAYRVYLFLDFVLLQHSLQ